MADTNAPTNNAPAQTATTGAASNSAPAAYDATMQGNEATAQQIVADARAANAPLAQVEGDGSAFNGMDILDDSATADAVQNVAPASGQPMSQSGARYNENVNTPYSETGKLKPLAFGSLPTTQTLVPPAAGQTKHVSVHSGEVLAAQFDPNSADLKMQGENLVMQFPNGGKIVLDGFAHDTQNMPTIALQSGALVAGGVIVAQLQGTQAELFNLETAAGPAAAGGGNFVYSDDMGSVIDLLNKLPPIGFTGLTFGQPDPVAPLLQLQDNSTPTPPVFVNGLPTAANAEATVDETNNPFPINGNNTAVGKLNIGFGSDGAGTPGVEALNNFTSDGSQKNGALTSNGEAVVVTLNNGVYTGDVKGVTIFTMQINADGSFVFTQFQPLDHADGSNPNDAINLNFGYSVTDGNGDVATATVVVHVLDDAPIAVDDVANVPNGGATATGNLLTNDTMSQDIVNTLKSVSFGGVTKDFNGANSVVVNGIYGVLTVNKDGSYSYAYNNAQFSGQFTEVFNYKLIDSDGDSSSAKLTVSIVDTGPGAPPAVDIVLDETNGLPQANINGHLTVADAVSFDLTTFSSNGSMKNGALSSGGVPVTVSLQNGDYVGMAGNVKVFEMILGDNGNYEFVQFKVLDHADGSNPNDAINLVFNYTVKDSDGDSAGNTITVKVIDDAPVAANDVGNIPNGSVTATGNLLSNDNMSEDVVNNVSSVSFGNTIKDFNGANSVVINGTYGALTVNKDGSYSYTYNTAAHTGQFTEIFNYKLVDGDGDSSNAKLTINIVDTGPGAPPAVMASVDETTDINHAIGGTLSVTDAVSFDLTTFSSNGSMKGGALFSNGVPVVVSLVNGDYVGKAGNVEVFKLTLGDNGAYNFVQKAPLDHADGSNINDAINLVFNYTVKDSDGDSAGNTITVKVIDDAPVAANDSNALANNQTVATGNLLTNDTMSKDIVNNVSSVSFGGTVKDFNGANSVVINGAYGVLTVNKDGSYSYTYNSAQFSGNHTENFTYKLVDSDGDSSNANLKIDIVDNGPGTPPNVTAAVDESVLSNSASGNLMVAGATVYGAGTVDGNSGFSSSGSKLANALTSDGVAVVVTLANGVYTGKAGAVEVFTLTVNANGSYNFVQKAVLDHALATDPNDVISLKFNYNAADADGDKVGGTITVNVADDAPVAVNDSNSLSDGGTATGNVLTNDNLSNDVVNIMKSIAVNGVVKEFGSANTVVINGSYGQLTINKDGSYSYKSTTTNDGTVKTENFTYEMKDHDGDISSANLTLNMEPPRLIVGENIDDKAGSNVPYEVGPGTGVITGGGAADILVGDVGGSSPKAAVNYNIQLILDVSGSMLEGGKLDIMKDAVYNLLRDINGYNGGTVKVHIIPFSTTAEPAASFTVTDDNGFQNAANFVYSFSTDQTHSTNFESALQAGVAWANGSIAGDKPLAGAKTVTYFVSDGDPYMYVDANGNPKAGTPGDAIMGEILGADGTNEVGMLQAFGEIIAVGIGVNSASIARLDQIDTGANTIDVKDPNDLSVALQGANPLFTLAAVGADTITGGDGNDIIFGDVVNTDALAQQYNLYTHPGAGWNVFKDLETNLGWTRAETIAYIKAHTEELGHETLNTNGEHRTGGNDTINAGAGNDKIYAQEGNDTVNAGEGNDIISGGSGLNTITGGAGADTFLFLKNSIGKDTITDYKLAEGDKLDISDLLVGSTYKAGTSSVDSFVKIDHTTGDVFVDKAGAGTFDAAHKIATLSNISSIDTINVILNDAEGMKTVHTS